MSFSEYVKWFRGVFGPEVTDKILDIENECIRKDEKYLNDFFEEYKRVEPIEGIENGYIIKGCKECLKIKLNVRNQDTPNFSGRINDNKYIIIGKEPRIPTDIHIAFLQSEHPLYKNLESIFPDIKKEAYITDISKCMSTNYEESKKKCMKTHLLRELEILLEINPNFKIILQGTGVELYFRKSKMLEPYSSNTIDNEIKARNDKLLFRREYIKLNKKEIPTVVFPHGAGRNSYLWNEIKERDTLSKIDMKLEEFGFYK